MSTSRPFSRRITAVALSTLTVAGGSLVLAACGGGGSGGTSPTASSGSGAPAAGAAPSGAPSGGAGGRGGFGGQNSAQLSEIRQCLTAAGIALPTARAFPSGRPSGFPSGRPTDFPSGRPTDFPSGGAFPSGRRGGGFGGLGSVFSNPQAAAAIKACGLTLPSRGPGGSAGQGAAGAGASASS